MNIGPVELILLLIMLWLGWKAAIFVGNRLLRSPKSAEKLEHLEDKVELLEYELEEERRRGDRQLQ